MNDCCAPKISLLEKIKVFINEIKNRIKFHSLYKKWGQFTLNVNQYTDPYHIVMMKDKLIINKDTQYPFRQNIVDMWDGMWICAPWPKFIDTDKDGRIVKNVPIIDWQEPKYYTEPLLPEWKFISPTNSLIHEGWSPNPLNSKWVYPPMTEHFTIMPPNQDEK